MENGGVKNKTKNAGKRLYLLIKHKKRWGRQSETQTGVDPHLSLSETSVDQNDDQEMGSWVQLKKKQVVNSEEGLELGTTEEIERRARQEHAQDDGICTCMCTNICTRANLS